MADGKEVAQFATPRWRGVSGRAAGLDFDGVGVGPKMVLGQFLIDRRNQSVLDSGGHQQADG